MLIPNIFKYLQKGGHLMENDFLTLIRTRRSIRAYKPDAVPADVLARVLEA